MSIKTALFLLFGLTILGVATVGTLASTAASPQLAAGITEFTIITVIVLAIILPAILWFIIKTLFDPLQEMIQVLHKIGASEFDAMVTKQSIAEIEKLGQAVNTISTQIQWTQKTLKEKAEQKEKVAADKMKEYEELSSFMTGREEKMIELKQEITELKRKLDVNPGPVPKQNR